MVVYHSHPEYFTRFCFIITQMYGVSFTHLDCGSLAFAFNPVCIILAHLIFHFKVWFIMHFYTPKMHVSCVLYILTLFWSILSVLTCDNMTSSASIGSKPFVKRHVEMTCEPYVKAIVLLTKCDFA